MNEADRQYIQEVKSNLESWGIKFYTKEQAQEQANRWRRYTTDLRIRFYKPIYEQEDFCDKVDKAIIIICYIATVLMILLLFKEQILCTMG